MITERSAEGEAMALGRRITVGSDAPIRVTSEDVGPQSGQSVLLRNRSDVSIDVGGSGVEAGEGFELMPDEALPADLTNDDLFVIAASGDDNRLDVLEVGIA